MHVTNLDPERLDDLFALIRQTIQEVYPDYYPAGVVDFFIRHHSVTSVSADLQAGRVYGVEEGGGLAGTVTVDGCDIKRMFVRPSLQRRGLGLQLMDYAELLVAHAHPFARLDASVPGYPFYFKRGYRTCECRKIELENGMKLVYQVMRKNL